MFGHNDKLNIPNNYNNGSIHKYLPHSILNFIAFVYLYILYPNDIIFDNMVRLGTIVRVEMENIRRIRK